MPEGQGRLRAEGVSAMLGVILKLLSVLGILLLVLLGMILLLLLLVLFFPVTYKAQGSRKADGEATLCISANWLLSLLRVRYAYPQPGKLTVKLLWHTLFSSDAEKKESEETEKKAGKEAVNGTKKENADRESKNAGAGGGTKKEDADRENTDTDKGTGKEAKEHREEAEKQAEDTEEKEDTEKETVPDNTSAEEDAAEQGSLAKKITKIKYTIRGIYDKIKEIWENMAYYADLLKEEETKQLFSHVCFRLGKIWKSVRPRHIKADVLFGTGSPDTTGYAFGIYGMLSPSLGSTVNVTPDFTQKVLVGEFSVSGHITAAVILANGLKVLFDRKLKCFIKKLKAGRK